ncbi:FAD-dependent oxidoreductase [soil metagenome]
MNSTTVGGRTVVVIGAGHAAGILVGLLRQTGFPGRIIMFGTETDLPYHRPPLSKSFSSAPVEQPLRDSAFYREQNVEVHLGDTVEFLDVAARVARTRTGESVAWDVLVFATGSVPRQLAVPGADLLGVQTLRTLQDARVLRHALEEGRPLAIVGAGYVGLEVAAAARAKGLDVTVIEREPRVLPRVGSAELARRIAQLHSARGVGIRTGVQVVGFEGEGEGASARVSGVALASGEVVECAFALVGVGAIAADELAAGAGVACDGGILVDGRARTSVENVFAIGDVSRRPVAGHATTFRLESIPSAVEEAAQAVAAIMSLPEPAPEVPWFWSDQFDLKIKIAGLLVGDHETVVRATESDDRFALFHHRAGELVAVESSNWPQAHMAGRRWLADRTRIDWRLAADPSVPLKDIPLEVRERV